MQPNPSKSVQKIMSRTRLPRELSTLIARAKDCADGQTPDSVARKAHTYRLFHIFEKMYIPWPHGSLKLKDRKNLNSLLNMSNLAYGGTFFAPVVICHRYDTNGKMDAEVVANAVDI